MGKLSKGARAAQQRAKKREERAKREAAIAALTAMRKRVRTDRHWRLAILGAVRMVQIERLVEQWKALQGPELSQRLHLLANAHANRSTRKQVAAACMGVFGASPKLITVVKHNRASTFAEDDTERFRNMVLYYRLEIRGVRGVIQSGGSQTQVQKEVWIRDWRVENYALYEPDLASLLAWLQRGVRKLQDGSAKEATLKLERTYGYARAVRDAKEPKARKDTPKADPAPRYPQSPLPKVIKLAVIPRIETVREVVSAHITLDEDGNEVSRTEEARTVTVTRYDVLSSKCDEFYGRYLSREDAERAFRGVRVITHADGRVERVRYVLLWEQEAYRAAPRKPWQRGAA